MQYGILFLGEVKEKAKARKEYKEAVAKGHGAYLMEEETPVSCSYCFTCMSCLMTKPTK